MNAEPRPMFDPLEGFLNWTFANVPMLGMVPLLDAVHDIEGVRSVTWYRSAPFQIQMFIVPGGTVIPEHTHPNVDSFEVYLGGQIRFSHLGRWVVPDDAFEVPAEGGLAQARGAVIRVRPGDIHGGVFGPSGGVFLSVQHWLNGVEPHCVSADYSGKVMGPHHLAMVKAGAPIAAEQSTLTASDAAGLEG